MAIRVETVYTGRVQGVGFRYTTYEIAKGFAVTGFVRNRFDGTVELVAEGAEPEIDSFLAAVRSRFVGNIRGEATDRRPATGEYSGFDIR